LNAIALAQAWHDLLQHQDQLRDMANKSRRAAEQFYHVDVMRDRFLEIAREVLDGGADMPSAIPDSLAQRI
jgi:hypothetical protein